MTARDAQAADSKGRIDNFGALAMTLAGLGLAVAAVVALRQGEWLILAALGASVAGVIGWAWTRRRTERANLATTAHASEASGRAAARAALLDAIDELPCAAAIYSAAGVAAHTNSAFRELYATAGALGLDPQTAEDG